MTSGSQRPSSGPATGNGAGPEHGHPHGHLGEDPDLPLLEPSSGLCGGPGQISCDEANEMIQMVIDELIDTEERNRLEEHLGDCSPCESEFVVYQRIVTSLSSVRPDMPADTASRLERYCDELRSNGTPTD